VYRSRNHPGLTVIDKENGGKADSLNTGLNFAAKDYFCGIDADSLLEPDALLKLASGSLDDPRFFAASGGNILPVNGCEVDSGSLNRIDIPRAPLALFQNVEYLRAFMCGRVGWSVVDGLLIISGAFGLFHAATVRSIGGYLTVSERFKKDTVGEDMELVLRLRRHLMEKKVAHVAAYAFNANCWTEVPETFPILWSQRKRWQRGLLDILFFHRRLLFNPAYGPIGLLALPYFLIFEALGPFLETTGLLMILAALFLGLMNWTLGAALFVTTVLLGIFISLVAVALSIYGGTPYPAKSLSILVLAAILENFGYRQIQTVGRCLGFFAAMRKPQGWGKMVRKGFATGGKS
jgi:cellulose synthase/poly-beta-1,6-N-acetylglucosamine synthase-like glycosyltransferase